MPEPTSPEPWTSARGIRNSHMHALVQPVDGSVVVSTATDRSGTEADLALPAAVAVELCALARTAASHLRHHATSGWDQTIEVPGQGTVTLDYDLDYEPAPTVHYALYSSDTGQEALVQLTAEELDTLADLLTSAAAAPTTTAPHPRYSPPPTAVDNPECAACGLTAADLPDEIGDTTLVFEYNEHDGHTYCQGCAHTNPTERLTYQ